MTRSEIQTTSRDDGTQSIRITIDVSSKSKHDVLDNVVLVSPSLASQNSSRAPDETVEDDLVLV